MGDITVTGGRLIRGIYAVDDGADRNFILSSFTGAGFSPGGGLHVDNLAGQAATVEVDTYPGRQWPAVVESISQATGSEFSLLPPQNATGNWVKVVQRIPVRVALEPEKGGPPLRAGMSVTVEIDTGHQRELPHALQTALAWTGFLTEPAQARPGASP